MVTNEWHKKFVQESLNSQWKNPFVTAGRNQGSTPTGQEFRGADHLVRETTQNSIDARRDSNAPVTITLEHQVIAPTCIPDFPGYLKQLQLRLDRLHELKTIPEVTNATDLDKEIKLLERILQAWKSPHGVHVLRFEDRNTIGLDYYKEGSVSLNGCSWSALVTSDNTSYKNKNKGGSFGQGSNTAFANSTTKMVFYESLGCKNQEYLCGGAAKLSSVCSFDSKGEEGVFPVDLFYGDSDSGKKPFKTQINNPLFKGRNSGDYGTSVIITGFYVESGFGDIDSLSNLAVETIAQYIINFRRAIASGALIVTLKEEGKEVFRLDSKEKAVSFIDKYFPAQDGENDINQASINLLDENEVLKRQKMYNILQIDKHFFKGEYTEIPIYSGKDKKQYGILYYIPNTPIHYTEASRFVQMRVEKPWENNRGRFCSPYAELFDVTDEETNSLMQKLENNTHQSWCNNSEIDKNDKEIKEAIKRRINIRRAITIEINKIINNEENKRIKVDIPEIGCNTKPIDSRSTKLRPKAVSINQSSTKREEPNTEGDKLHETTRSGEPAKGGGKREKTKEKGGTGRKCPEIAPIATRILATHPKSGKYLVSFKTLTQRDKILAGFSFEIDTDSEKQKKSKDKLMPVESVTFCKGATAKVTNEGKVLLFDFTNQQVTFEIIMKKKGLSKVVGELENANS